MVVRRPSVARMVGLHTGTMGVHPACFFVDGAGIIASPARNLARNYSSYLVHPTPHRAPTGECQAIMALLFCSVPGGPPWFKGGVEPGRAPAGEGRELLRPWELNSRPSSLGFETKRGVPAEPERLGESNRGFARRTFNVVPRRRAS